MMKTQVSHGIICWGSSKFGQDGHDLGEGETLSFQDGLVQDDQFQGRIKLASCGSSHTVVVTDTDEIYAWGNGTSGQIASPDLTAHRSPIKVTLDPPLPDDVGVTQVACGTRHTLVLLSNGDIYAFGNNFYAQLGYDFQTENYKENQPKPALLRNVLHKSVRQVACGDKHSLFLFEDGSVSAVGNNSHGQLGDGTRKESMVPKPVDLDFRARQIACGKKHNVVISEAGDVYVWGYCKGCGHRRNDVLSPELKLPAHDIVQVTAGGYHSLALSSKLPEDVLAKCYTLHEPYVLMGLRVAKTPDVNAGHNEWSIDIGGTGHRWRKEVVIGDCNGYSNAESGHLYAWGFGTDGQLGLGESVITSSIPRRIRHHDLRANVSYVACGETYSAAVTSEGIVYMWGKNNHLILADEAENKSIFQPTRMNQSESRGMTSVHSVQCGTWHTLALLGKPDWEPLKDDSEESDNDDEENGVDDDGMTSEGSEYLSGPSSAEGRTKLILEDNSFGFEDRPEVSSACPSHTGINKSTSPLKAVTNQSPLPAPGRGKTKLTLGEFYELTDSSPSQSKSNTPKSSPRSMVNMPVRNGSISTPANSVASSDKEFENNEGQNHDEKDSNKDVKENPSVAIMLCPEVHVSSPTISPDFSVLSECSLKKRMAENIERNKGINFKTRDWSGQRRAHRMSPMMPVNMTPSPELNSPQGRLTPRASCRSKAASLTERSHTMFISKSTADHFSLPREQTFFSRQNVSLMDLGNLRTGAVFDNQDSENPSRETSAGHFHSNASSRLSMVSPYTDTELKDILSQKSPDKMRDPFQSLSDTPSNMMRYKRMKEMTSSLHQNGEKPQTQSHILFGMPSSNFGSGSLGDGEMRQHSDMHMNRSKTMLGLPSGGSSKFYRKPGFPGVDIKTKMVRPGHLQGPRKHNVDGVFQNGKIDKPSDLFMPRTLSTLEITSTSQKNGVVNGVPQTDPHCQDNGFISHPFVDLSPRRPIHPTGSVWRTKTIVQPRPDLVDMGALKSDGAFRKDFPDRSFHKNSNGNSKNNVILMKKTLLLEKAQTSLAISGAGASGPKGQPLRQINTSASSRNHKKK